MLRYEDLKNKPKEWLAATGLNVDEFEARLSVFAKTSETRTPADETVDGNPRQRRRGGGGQPALSAMSDQWLFILVYEKT